MKTLDELLFKYNQYSNILNNVWIDEETFDKVNKLRDYYSDKIEEALDKEFNEIISDNTKKGE